ncbi:MAG: hypothetical protein ACTSRS_13205 [Candidatus Helarchaeota archaeon]
MASVNTTDFSSYSVIIIGGDTDLGFSPWGTPEQSNAVFIAGKPILGIYRGGGAFFDNISLDIGWGDSWIGSMNDINVTNSSSSIFTQPLAVSTTNPVTICTSVDTMAVYAPSPGTDIQLIGRETDEVNHYPIIMQQNKYILWDFNSTPAEHTTNGDNLFVNLVYYLDKGSIQPDIPGFELIFVLLLLMIAIVFARNPFKWIER